MDRGRVCTPLLLRWEQHSLLFEKSNNSDFDFQPDCFETQSSALMPSTRAKSQRTLRNDSHFGWAWRQRVPAVEVAVVDGKVVGELYLYNFEL